MCLKDWLMGDPRLARAVGHDLRREPALFMHHDRSAVGQARQEFHTRPPMQWFNVTAMTEPDLRALYAYIRSLKPLGNPAPDNVPPDKEPIPPFIQFPAPPPK